MSRNAGGTLNAAVLALPGNEILAACLVRELPGEAGSLTLRDFPDGETYLRIQTAVAGRPVVIACGLEHPDAKAMPLHLLASTARELGAARIVLATPYLPYMRQDRPFQAGEGTAARHFARWLSGIVDGLVTVDPHLHRIHRLDEIYSVPARVVPAAAAIADWIRGQVHEPLVIGPDAESKQWVAEVARAAGCPYRVQTKQRRGDREVEVSVPQVEQWRGRTPVLVDDIISTGHTMMAAVAHLRRAGMPPPVCIGVHAVFAGDAWRELLDSGAGQVVTCNTIAHLSNAIDVHPLVARAVAGMLAA